MISDIEIYFIEELLSIRPAHINNLVSGRDHDVVCVWSAQRAMLRTVN